MTNSNSVEENIKVVPPKVYILKDPHIGDLRHYVEVNGKIVYKDTKYNECVRVAQSYNLHYIDLTNF